jgi:hypothetical protein
LFSNNECKEGKKERKKEQQRQKDKERQKKKKIKSFSNFRVPPVFEFDIPGEMR